MNTIPFSELKSVLKRSEEHALTCTIDYGTSLGIYRRQIAKGFLTLAVSSKMMKQAIKVLDVFLQRMYKEGFSLVLDCDTHIHCPASALVIDGELIPIRLKEKRAVQFDYSGNWKYSRYVPTGVLALEIYGGTSSNFTKVLEETKSQKWEDCFERIIPYLHAAAKRIKADRLETEAWRRRMEEQRRIRKEHEQEITGRATVVKSIMKDIQFFEKAETIRHYCDIAANSVKSEAFKAKIEVARQIADWIDPTIDYVDEILAERYSIEDFLK